MLGHNKCGIKDQLEKGQIIQKMEWQKSNYQKKKKEWISPSEK